MTYDLLIKGGHVLDPGQGLDGIRDIAITDGKITKIAAGIPPEDAHRVVEIHGAGRHVVPGLIDLHTHVAARATPTTSASGPASPRSWTAGRSASPTSASSPRTSCPGPGPGSP